jgi:hypothetical protein
MSSTVLDRPDTAPPAARDRLPSQRLTGTAFAVGGLAYAASHALHLLGPDAVAGLKPLIEALFAGGALLLMAGTGSVQRLLRRSVVGVIGAAAVWIGMVFVVLSAYLQLFVLPIVGWDGLARIDAAAGPLGALAILGMAGGPVLIAVGGLRHRAVPMTAAVGLLIAVATFAVGVSVAELQAPMMISSTIVLGLAFALIGRSAARAR